MGPLVRIASVASLAMLAGGCLGGPSASPTTGGGSTLPVVPSQGAIQGRVFTTRCGVTTCGSTPYRGSLTFCRTMNQIGPCPSARVDADGRYRIALMPGRYALVPAPGAGNQVIVKPRWVAVGEGQMTTLDIDGGSLTD
jgi:hypothetical protein